MKNEQKTKLEVIVNFLTENKMLFFTSFKGKAKVTPDLYVPKYKIMIKISEGKEKDDIFFNKVKHGYHPLFIRETETKEFVLEKMQNLLIDLMKQRHNMIAKRKYR